MTANSRLYRLSANEIGQGATNNVNKCDNEIAW